MPPTGPTPPPPPRLRAVLALVGVTLLALLGLPPVPAGAVERSGAGPGRVAPDEVDAFLEAQVRRHRIPGLAVALVGGGQVTYRAGYGEVTPETPAPVGALGETLTAIVVLQLADKGRLELDRPVGRYLRGELPRGVAPEETVRELLERRRRPAGAGVGSVLVDPGYVTLRRLVEEVTGEEYAGLVRSRVLTPLGMTATSVGEPGDVDREVAGGHVRVFGFPVGIEAPPRLGDADGGAVLTTTATDLAALAASVGLRAGPQVLGSDELQLMQDTGADATGMGWDLLAARGGLGVGGRTGLAPTYAAQLAVLPERGVGFVVVMSSDHLLDALLVMPQLREGLLDLLEGRASAPEGPTVRLLGLALLGFLVVSLALHAWSVSQLRHWRRRARHLTRGAIARAVAPHAVMPVVVLVLAWPLVPDALGGRIGELPGVVGYLAPDLALLMLVAVVPDLAKAAYMVVTAVRVRRSRRPRWARLG